jgi:hypothetical protein
MSDALREARDLHCTRASCTDQRRSIRTVLDRSADLGELRPVRGSQGPKLVHDFVHGTHRNGLRRDGEDPGRLHSAGLPAKRAHQRPHKTAETDVVWFITQRQLATACSTEILPTQTRYSRPHCAGDGGRGMARVRSGQAPAWPLSSGRSVRRDSRVKRDFACTGHQEPLHLCSLLCGHGHA